MVSPSRMAPLFSATLPTARRPTQGRPSAPLATRTPSCCPLATCSLTWISSPCVDTSCAFGFGVEAAAIGRCADAASSVRTGGASGRDTVSVISVADSPISRFAWSSVVTRVPLTALMTSPGKSIPDNAARPSGSRMCTTGAGGVPAAFAVVWLARIIPSRTDLSALLSVTTKSPGAFAATRRTLRSTSPTASRMSELAIASLLALLPLTDTRMSSTISWPDALASPCSCRW
mmetsp:Transcript_27123/g.67153  ORF Transcript_27123/g.67153 Transcript_27123/m.67153 type:complete len:232 (+) Transcript_27123:511-1206(+)